MLKPQDVLVAMYLALHEVQPLSSPAPALPPLVQKPSFGEGNWTYPSLAAALGLSASEAHACVRRAQESGLYDALARRVRKPQLLEFLVHGVRYAYPVVRGALTRGVPTAHGAAPLREKILTSTQDATPVWPDPEGDVRGEAWQPLYPSVPAAARRDPALYEALALVDAIRGGRARERALAVEELKRRFA